MPNVLRLVVAPIFCSCLSFGQVPSISPGGIVNAASFAGVDQAYHALAPGSLATIFGTNLASGMQAAASTPLPTSLLGTSVSVNGVPAPLLYVSPTQINLQLPNTLNATPGISLPTPVIVTTLRGSSLPVSFDAGAYGPGLFTVNGSGCGPGAVQNVSASGQVTLNSPANSVQPGEFLTAYGTGYGNSNQRLADGVPAPTLPLYPLVSLTLASLDGSFQDVRSFGGFAPGLVGVDQINFQVTEAMREGCAVPLTIENTLTVSQPVTVAVHRGGGACVDPPPAADGTILLKRVITAGTTTSDGTVDTLDATFAQSPGRKATTIDPFDGQHNGFGTMLLRPVCPIPGYQQLSAGTLSLHTPSSTVDGIVAASVGNYHVELPPNTLLPGTSTVTASGQTGTGAFQAAIPFGQDIQIQTPPPPVGSTLSRDGSITLSWSGGDPKSLVSVTLISHLGTQTYRSTCGDFASVGHCTLPTIILGRSIYTDTVGTPQGELLYQIDPNPLVTPFSAPGLSLGGQATWRIQHSFQGFAIAF